MRHVFAMALTAGVLIAVMSAREIPLAAHHAISASYVADRLETIDGTVVEVQVINPHSLLQVESTDAQGRPVLWTIEWGGGLELSRQGVRRYTVKPGDHVTIMGNPSRKPDEHRLLLGSINRPSDGWRWTRRQAAQ